MGEEARLKHRYLDLRRSGPSAALRLRSKVSKTARDVLDAHDFVEVETPTLTRSTPEGARDFLVPARLQPGSWYALPQSPQLFKQLLMVAGLERYYQIARCYRDEDFRADRQPEFTQLDVEMSFVEQDDVIALTEEILVALWRLIGYELPTPLPRLTYAEAMARFGTDKPDLRMGLELVDCTEFFAAHPVPGLPGAVRRRGGDARRSRAAAQAARRLAGVGQAARRPRAGLPAGQGGRRARRPGREEHQRRGAGRDRRPRRRRSPATASSSGPDRSRAAARCSGPLGSRSGAAAASSTRTRGASLWVLDAPLLEPAAEATAAGDVAVGGGQWTAVHHAFTSPQDPDNFDKDPGNALAWAYDVVCNGNEIGGGSIRIHRSDVQKRVFALMGLDEEAAQEKFGFLLDAFAYGAAAARRHRPGLGPDLRAAQRVGLDPRGDRLPEERRRLRPAHRQLLRPISAEQRKEAGVDARPDENVPSGGPAAERRPRLIAPW